MAPEQPQTSQFYAKNPIFVHTAPPAQGSRFKRHKGLIVVAIIVLVATAVVGVWFFRNGFQTGAFSSDTPFMQQKSPLLP